MLFRSKDKHMNILKRENKNLWKKITELEDKVQLQKKVIESLQKGKQ